MWTECRKIIDYSAGAKTPNDLHAGVTSFVILCNFSRRTALDDLHCWIPKIQSALSLFKKYILEYTCELFVNMTDLLYF